MAIVLEEFYLEIIRPHTRDFEEDRASLRRAYGAVWALDSYASHIFYHFRDSKSLSFSGDIDYKKNFLAKECPEFCIIMDVSAATKHAVRSTKSTSVLRSSELQTAKLDGWAAYFAGPDGDEWGDQVVIHNDQHFFAPLLPKVLRVEVFLHTVQESLEQ